MGLFNLFLHQSSSITFLATRPHKYSTKCPPAIYNPFQCYCIFPKWILKFPPDLRKLQVWGIYVQRSEVLSSLQYLCYNYVDLIDLTEDIFSEDDYDLEEPKVTANATRFVHCHNMYFCCHVCLLLLVIRYLYTIIF